MGEAWVRIPSNEQLAEIGFRNAGQPYGFGFFPAMGRLVMTHARIAPAFGALFSEVMFAEGQLSRREREMVAGVAAAAQDCFY